MSTAFKLRNGTILLSTEAPGGIYNAAQLKKIASLCEGEIAIVKATEDQRLALCVKPEQANAIANELKSIGLGIRHYQDGLHHPTSCIGELCPDHEQDALGSALDISQQLDAIKLASPLKIGINGCARCCVPCHTLDISVVGDASGYRMHLGGKNSQLPEMASFMAEGIPPTELPGLILKVIALYQQYAEPSESLQEVIERVGSTEFIAILAPYSQDAAGDADPFATQSASAAVDLATEDGHEEVASDEALELTAEDDLSLTTDDLSVTELNPITSEENFDESVDTLVQEPGESLSLVENTDLSMSSPSEEVDLSVVSDDLSIDTVDINPNNGSMDELNSEVAILSSSDAATDISLSDDFAEDNIDSPDFSAVAVEDEQLISNDIDLEALPEAELISTDLDEMEEAKIDVSDVMKTSAPAAAASTAPIVEEPMIENTELESPIDEDAYEKQLTASIAAQEQLVDQSHSDEERDQALDLLSDTEATLDEVSFAEESNVELDDEFVGADELEAPTDLAPDLDLEPEMIVPEAAAEQDIPEIAALEEIDDEFESTNPHDHLPLSEVVGTSAVKGSSPTLIHSTPAATPPKKSGGWSFAGFDIDGNSNPVISFANGVQITLTEEAIANGSINIGGHTITLASINGGIELKMDGMKMFLPKAA